MSLFDKLQNSKNEKIATTKAEGAAYLENNAKQEGVIALPSGLQYKVLEQGESNQQPTLYNKVTCHYHGMLLNGDVFDSSVQRNQPATFPLNAVIKGWQEGVQLMTVGSKYVFYIPSDLAYGDQQAGAKIAPGNTLIFEVELLGIN
jgi:FKBP-type peptidyl-prolyl cis-trans isomerase FklB